MQLFKITFSTKIAPLDALKKSKTDNKNDRANRLIGMSTSEVLWLYLQHIDTPFDTGWTWSPFAIFFINPSLCGLFI